MVSVCDHYFGYVENPCRLSDMALHFVLEVHPKLETVVNRKLHVKFKPLKLSGFLFKIWQSDCKFMVTDQCYLLVVS